jgi:hypothetical protein
MGMDVEISARGNVTQGQINVAIEFLENRDLVDPYLMKVISKEDYGAYLHSMDRYYGVGYERGHWPQIFANLVAMKAAFPHCDIYYGNDHTDFANHDKVTESFLREMWLHWASPDHNNYRKRF